MNKIFCTNCGNKMESAVAINFCSKCGQSLNGSSKARQIDRVEQQYIDAEEMESEAPRMTDISKLKDKIKVSVQMDGSQPVKIGEYLEMAKSNGSFEEKLPPRRKDNLPKGKNLLKKIVEECASSRDRSSEVGE